jgi:hypothetical protein
LRWYRHILRTNEKTTPKKQKVLNMEVKRNCPTGRLSSRWKQQVRKDVTWEEGRIRKETEAEGEQYNRWTGLVGR